jgi:hypothetical protein
MSNEHDDAAEWIEQCEDYVEHKATLKGLAPADYVIDKEEPKSIVPGKLTQYSLYGPGYKPVTSTVSTLPPGCYDITYDSNGIFVVPVPKPSGLLLELPEMRSSDVIKLIENFWASEKDYKEGNEFVIGGALFKAGVMLYGPAGSGKSCTIKLVCNKLVEKGGTVFYASCAPSPINQFLTEFATVEPNRKCIVILEDIDSLIQNYGEANYLEMLDSAKTIDNVLFIATTNYPERLDPRIYNRPGRFSHVVKIGLPTERAREAYLKAILKNHKDVPEIVKGTNGFSIDHLSALINSTYREKKSLTKEIERLKTLFRIPKSEEGRSMGMSDGGWN